MQNELCRLHHRFNLPLKKFWVVLFMFTFRTIFFPLLKLALPFAFTGLLQACIFLFETIFLSHLGVEILTAGALVTWLYTTLIVIIIGILGSTNILISYYLGSNKPNAISMVIRDSFRLAVILVFPVFFIVWYIADAFSLVGQSVATIQLANAYLHALSWGLLPHFLVLVLLEAIIGLGHVATVLKITVLTVSLSIFLSFSLIFGHFGFPTLGIAGAGWGITLSYWITFFILAFYVFSTASIRQYLNQLFVFSRFVYFYELLQIGTPMGIMYCFEMAFFLVLTIMMSTFGNEAVAANQIALQYMETLTAVVFSIAQAVTVRMSYLLGANQPLFARYSAYMGLTMAVLFMLVAAIFELFLPNVLISFNFDVNDFENAGIVQLAREFLAISTLFQLLEAARLTLFGALRSLKDTRMTLVISMISFWLIALPSGYFWATKIQLGSPGIWWGMVIGSAFSIPLILLRFSTLLPHQTEAFAS